jgi:SAM-dependent methyltransferase
MIEEDRKNIFVRLLTTMWLRPERALYEAYILSKLKRIIEPHLHGNTLELGCLDGTPSFAMLGGVFADDFDDYIGLDNQASPKKMGASRSSYLDDYFEHYHASDSVLAVKVATEKKFKFGISYKKSHIERAQRLDLYSHLWQQDLWAPLPFGDKTLDLIYAPLLFWLAPRSTLQSTLRELNRCMRGNGRLVATFPKANHHQYLMLHKFKYGDSAWRREIDGGIAEKLALTNLELSDLELVFRQCGFCLEAIEETVPVLVSQINEKSTCELQR